MRIVDYTPEHGRMFYAVAKGAIQFAREHVRRDGMEVRANFVFNDIFMEAYSHSSERDICLIYSLKCRIRRFELGLEG
jgi:hypothetical protein